MSLSVIFDTPISSISVDIIDTLTPIAYCNIDILIRNGFSVALISRLVHNLLQAHNTHLPDVSPLFASPIGRPHRQPWKRQKCCTPLAPLQIITTRAPQSRFLHADYHLPNANAKQIRLLTVLIRLYLEHILAPFFRGPSPHLASTSTHWGQLRKYHLSVTVAYPMAVQIKNKPLPALVFTFRNSHLSLLCAIFRRAFPECNLVHELKHMASLQASCLLGEFFRSPFIQIVSPSLIRSIHTCIVPLCNTRFDIFRTDR
jgi:hypothetical protein